MDKTTTKVTLVLNAEFTDGDTRTITIDNAREDLTVADVEAIEATAIGVLIGDVNGAPFSTFKGAAIRKTTTTAYSLSA